MDKQTKLWIAIGAVGVGIWYLMRDRVGTVEAGPLVPSYGAGGGSTMGELSKTSPVAQQGISLPSQPTYVSAGELNTVPSGPVSTPLSISPKDQAQMEQPTGKNYLYVGSQPVVKIADPRAGLNTLQR